MAERNLRPNTTPFGCKEVSATTLGRRFGAIVSRVIEPKGDKWLNYWKRRETVAKEAFFDLCRDMLLWNDPFINEFLNETEKTSGYPYRVLFAQGLKNLQSGDLVIATHNQMGLRPNKGIIVDGGKIIFSVHSGTKITGGRQAAGEFIGVVINPNSGIVNASLHGKNEVSVGFKQLASVIGAVVNAELFSQRAAEGQEDMRCMTQTQFDEAVNWVVGI